MGLVDTIVDPLVDDVIRIKVLDAAAARGERMRGEEKAETSLLHCEIIKSDAMLASNFILQMTNKVVQVLLLPNNNWFGRTLNLTE
mmetsp:Transcript_21787/g.51696  ORF Transcript_21787/g.51696 Transcript_21787/m.51696 type:complete len:86 (-) Transcript_21787:53-310(-)